MNNVYKPYFLINYYLESARQIIQLYTGIIITLRVLSVHSLMSWIRSVNPV